MNTRSKSLYGVSLLTIGICIIEYLVRNKGVLAQYPFERVDSS
jgi:hypothetical protein